jgi:POT family proton-dependent oligopeptide transporter
MLNLVGVIAFGSIIATALRSDRIVRDRLTVVLVLCFFSMLFWAFFEQAGSSVNNFTDRNVDRVVGGTDVREGQVYTDVVVTQEFLGVDVNGRTWTLTDIEVAQKAQKEGLPEGRITFTADAEDVAKGLVVGGDEVKASVFQAANPTFILLFGPVFSWLWGALGRRDPSAGVKFALGLLQLAAGFACFWMGARSSDSNGMTAMQWLLLGYLLQTTGELCLSPVGLSLVTKLSPAAIASTIMGAWFIRPETSFISRVADMTRIRRSFLRASKESRPRASPPWWALNHSWENL